MSYSVIVITEAEHARSDNPISQLWQRIGRDEQPLPDRGEPYLKVYSIYRKTQATSMRSFRQRYGLGEEEVRAFHFLNDTAIDACRDFGIGVSVQGTVGEEELPEDKDTFLDRTYKRSSEMTPSR